jgi:TonB-dependent SusC/RagA subfamily outer membrane receptor
VTPPNPRDMSTPERIFNKGFLILAFLGLAACAGTGKTASSNPDPKMVDDGYTMTPADQTTQSNIRVKPNKDQPSNLSLSEMIQRLPGVSRSGSGFVVSGTSQSFMSGTAPLYVVNGRAIGTDFSVVNSMVNPREVTSINVLKGADATIYGTRGANGVIVIRTKAL